MTTMRQWDDVRLSWVIFATSLEDAIVQFGFDVDQIDGNYVLSVGRWYRFHRSPINWRVYQSARPVVATPSRADDLHAEAARIERILHESYTNGTTQPMTPQTLRLGEIRRELAASLPAK